jgi:hypothetical protein
MASGRSDPNLDALTIAMRAASKLSRDPNPSEDISSQLTPAMLAGAIKLASLSPEHHDKLTPANVNQAVRLAKHNTQKATQSYSGFNEESLAMSLKVVLHGSASESGKPAAANDALSSNTASIVMKTAAALNSLSQEHESITPDTLASAIQRPKRHH